MELPKHKRRQLPELERKIHSGNELSSTKRPNSQRPIQPLNNHSAEFLKTFLLPQQAV